MKPTSLQIFEKHFEPSSLSELVDIYLTPSSARGVDGMPYDRFIERKDDEIKLISSRALSASYLFSPYRQKLIIKNSKSAPRQISIPTIRDKIALRALNNFLAEIFSDSRPKHVHPVISSAISALQVAKHDDALIKLDIRAFYDEINHDVLLRNLRRRIRSDQPMAMIGAAITTPTGTNSADGVINSVGVPQGLSISNILASIYLQSIDEKYESMLGVSYYRYVDDILCISEQQEASSIAKSITKDLKTKKKLTVHPVGDGKSKIQCISEEVEYLGYLFQAAKISVRKTTEKKLLSSLIRIIQSASEDSLPRDLWRLNLRISGCRLNDSNVGWIFYFSQINDLRLLSRIDAQTKKHFVRKFGSERYKNCKRLIKAYHEVKHNTKESQYFQNFDKFDKDEMAALLNKVFPGRFPKIEGKSESDVRRIFNRVVTREVREMERDTLGGFS